LFFVWLRLSRSASTAKHENQVETADHSFGHMPRLKISTPARASAPRVRDTASTGGEYARLGTEEAPPTPQRDVEQPAPAPALAPVPVAEQQSLPERAPELGSQPEPEFEPLLPPQPETEPETEPEPQPEPEPPLSLKEDVQEVNSGVTDAAATAVGRHDQRAAQRGWSCCSPPRPPTLVEAIDDAVRHAKAGDLKGLQAAVTHARTFEDFAWNTPGTESRTMMYAACHSRQPDVVKWLLEQKGYAADADNNKDAYTAICATGRGNVTSADPGERAAALMREKGYTGAGTPTSSPGTSPRPEPDPQPQDEPEQPQARRRCPFACWQPYYERLTCSSVPTYDGPKYKLTKESKKLIGREKSFREQYKPQKIVAATGKQGPSATGMIIDTLESWEDQKKHELELLFRAGEAKPVQVTVVLTLDIDGQDGEQQFTLPAEICRFEEVTDEPEPPPDDGDLYGFSGDVAVFPDWTDDMITYDIHKETTIPRSSGERDVRTVSNIVVVGDGSDARAAIYVYSRDKTKKDHKHMYEDCKCDSQRQVDISRKGSVFTLRLEDKIAEYEVDSEQAAESICYYVRLGYTAWNIREQAQAGHADGYMAWLAGAAIDILDVDASWCGRCKRACSKEKWKGLCVSVQKLVGQCCKRFCAFFRSDVHPDYTTPTCIWFWIFGLQVASHLLCPLLVLWPRTRKHYEMSTQLVCERCAVLLIRWLVVGGTLVSYTLGLLPSMASSEATISVLMWVFVAVTHSANEASLDEAPDAFDDTFTGWFHQRSRHVSTTSGQGADRGQHQIEHELVHFLHRKGQNRQGKFSHRMTERRLHDLHSSDMKIDQAHFECFHSQALAADLAATGTSCDFDEVITTLQLFLPEGWCLNAQLGEHLEESVVPDSVRKAVAMVRMHIKAIRREHYTATHENAAYAFEVDRLAGKAAKWEMTGPEDQEEAAKHCVKQCVLTRDDFRQSHTETTLREWDELAERVIHSLSGSQGQTDDRLCTIHAAKLLVLMVFSSGLVLLWLWLGHQLTRHILAWALLECTTVKCTAWSLATVLAMVLIIISCLFTAQSCRRRVQTFKTLAFSKELIKEVEDCVKKWEDWNCEREKRKMDYIGTLPVPGPGPSPEPEPKPEQDSDMAGGADMFAEDDAWDDELEPEPEPEPELESEPEGDASSNVGLAKLTALCADKLHVEKADGRSASTWWSDLSTKEFDQLTLELSRVDQAHRKTVLNNWCDLRTREIMLKAGIDQEWQLQEDEEELDRESSLEETKRSVRDLWKKMVECRVTREKEILTLRADLIVRVKEKIQREHGSGEFVGAEQDDIETGQATQTVEPTLSGAYKKDKLQASIVAECILALAHMQSKKLYKTHLWCIVGFCVLDALCHPIKDAISSGLGVPVRNKPVFSSYRLDTTLHL
jgi:hypothetical protein